MWIDIDTSSLRATTPATWTEYLYPVATVIIGTLLEFFVRPALFWALGRDAGQRTLARDAAEPELLNPEP